MAAPISFCSGSEVDPVVQAAYSESLGFSESETGRAPLQQGVSERLRARHRLITSLHEVLLMLDDDNDVTERHDDGHYDDARSVPAVFRARQ
jgi:hypothetical protein